jgi:hypothetical protein
MPGDRLVPDPMGTDTNGITVKAPLASLRLADARLRLLIVSQTEWTYAI